MNNVKFSFVLDFFALCLKCATYHIYDMAQSVEVVQQGSTE